MMGGGLCWLDYDSDGWLDLFVVNSYADVDISASEERGGLPRSALFRNVGGRFEDVSSRSGRGSPAPRQRLRRSRPRPRRPHGPLRDERRLQRAHRRLRRAALERRRRDVHGGRREGRHRRARLALRRRGRRRQRRRPSRPLRDGATPTRTSGVELVGRLPVEPPSRVRDLLYLNVGTDDAGSLTFREVAQGRRHRADARRTRARRGVHRRRPRRTLDLYVANDADPNQLYRNVPVAAADTNSLGFRFDEVAKQSRGRRPERRHGRRSGGLQSATAGSTCSSRTRAGSSTPRTGARERQGAPFADARPDFAAVVRDALDRAGATPGPTSISTATSTSALANGAIPVVDLAKDAQRDPDPRERLAAQRRSRGSRPSTGSRPPAGAPASTAADSRRPTTTTTATSTSPSTRSAGG